MKRIRLSRKLAIWAGASLAAVAGVVVLLGVGVVWTDYLWYQSVGQHNVFWVRYLSMGAVWITCTAVAFAATYLSARSAWKSVSNPPRSQGLTALACLALAGIMSLTMSGQWMVFRLAAAQSPFGLTDPQFGFDVGFFVFTLPALELFNRWLAGLVVLAMIVIVAIVFGAMRLDTTGVFKADWWHLKTSFSVLAGLLIITSAANSVLAIWQLSFSTIETPFAGASYADIHAQLPANAILALLALGVALILFVTASSKKFKPALAAFGVWAIAAVLLGSVWPSLVQTYIAAPNEASLEAPYIARNIEMTRNAFDLAGVKGRAYPGLESLDASASAAAKATLTDATIWTPSSVQQAFAQLQTIRPYYKLSAIDYDRYEFNGGLNQVLVAARQIDSSGLPPAAQTWVNKHLVYTHGYGLAISSTSRTERQGFPEFIVGDVPPRIMSAEASRAVALDIVEPRIYFGPDQTDYVIVNTGLDEFDYPAGETNVTNRYEADSGVQVGGLLRRLAWAVRLQSSEILFSRYLTAESRVLLNRGVLQRATKLAPWLTYDAPYAAIVDGRVMWIMDAYTASDHYPYSQPIADGTNYLRDSVKVTIDALSGEMRFYANGDDPIRDAWARIFKTIITPASAMPASVAKHIRSPQRLFSAQAATYSTYHMTDTMVFYNQEDRWAIPKDSNGKPVAPAYLMLDMPDKAGKGMYLLQPYSLPNRANLVGWMATACEPGVYGDRTVYLLPKERVILGSAQVTARINQDPEIAQQLTLWNQPGSTVLFGSMLVLPVEGTVAYIQPMFLQAQNNSLTELVSVIAVNGDRVALAPTLQGALAKAYGSLPTSSTPASRSTTQTVPGN